MGLAILVSIAAAVGAVARYSLDGAVQRRYPSVVPWGTFVINVTGSFALGIVTGLASHHGLDSRWQTVLGAGLLGGYTTWSTYMWETFALTNDRRLGIALQYAGSSLLFGLGAAAAGLALGRI
jgi:CrcB protein